MAAQRKGCPSCVGWGHRSSAGPKIAGLQGEIQCRARMAQRLRVESFMWHPLSVQCRDGVYKPNDSALLQEIGRTKQAVPSRMHADFVTANTAGMPCTFDVDSIASGWADRKRQAVSPRPRVKLNYSACVWWFTNNHL